MTERDPKLRGIVAYPNSRPYDRRVAASVVCPECGGRKSTFAMACWWCAGQPEPKLRPGALSVEQRMLNALWRNHPRYRRGPRPSNEELIRWGQAQPDWSLAEYRNVGAKSLAWLKSQVVEGVESPPTPGSYEDGYRAGVEATRRALQAALDSVLLTSQDANAGDEAE